MLAFTTDELITAIRSELDDKVTAADGSDFGCLWSNADLYRYLTGACDAVAKKVGSLYKTVRIPLVAGNNVVPLPQYVTNIREARLVDGNVPLEQANANSLGLGAVRDYGLHIYGGSALFDGATGVPCSFVRDYERKALLLAPAPAVGNTLELQCETTISLPQEAGMPLPFPDAEDQQLLIHFVMWRAYSKHDAETEDLVRAKYHMDLYTSGANDRKSELRNQRRGPPIMRMNW